MQQRYGRVGKNQCTKFFYDTFSLFLAARASLKPSERELPCNDTTRESKHLLLEPSKTTACVNGTITKVDEVEGQKLLGSLTGARWLSQALG
jgi:hypothetical protein